MCGGKSQSSGLSPVASLSSIIAAMALRTRSARSCRVPVEARIADRCGGLPSRVRSGPKGRWSSGSPNGRPTYWPGSSSGLLAGRLRA
eukprot:7604471-Lingulodinium_polyedra.AAC.1